MSLAISTQTSFQLLDPLILEVDIRFRRDIFVRQSRIQLFMELRVNKNILYNAIVKIQKSFTL